MTHPLIFTSFLVKVASRCNLNCSYCYMYQHADQSWKDKPRILSSKHQGLLIQRIREYVEEKKLKKILIVYHGGEPLLFGEDRLIALTKNMRINLSSLDCQVDFGIQTNGVLLKEEMLKKFEKENISVSLSIDGPKEIHDQYRLDHKGKPSFDQVYRGLLLLRKFPKVFSGCIAVINPYFHPKILFNFFSENEIKEFGILLPDANHLTPPKDREKHPSLYKDWLIQAFDEWFDHYQHIQCKFFEDLLMTILGQTGQTDALGLGDVSMLNIETDGSYHDLDVLKITEENYSNLGMDLESHPIKAAEQAPKILLHRNLLTKKGLSQKCQACRHVDICGGGSVPHRYSKEGYQNPTVYCEEMFSLIDHILERFNALIEEENRKQNKLVIHPFSEKEMKAFFDSKTAHSLVLKLQNHLAEKNFSGLKKVSSHALKSFPSYAEDIKRCETLSFSELRPILLHPPLYAWLRAMQGDIAQTPARNIAGKELDPDPSYFSILLDLLNKKEDPQELFIIQDQDPWYAKSLEKNIILNHPIETYQVALNQLQKSLEVIKDYDLNLYQEIQTISRNIQIIKDKKANPEKDVSFSDETLPGAIFIDVWKGNGLLSPYQIAASIIHEHLHQKLYLLQQSFLLFPPQETLIFSPWPQKYRPPTGALHAVYVFTHIAYFWKDMSEQNKVGEMAQSELEDLLTKLDPCIQEIKEKVSFTKTGQLFFNCLLNKYYQLKEQCVLEYA